MKSPIPVQNLYYLLSYAWDDRLKTVELEKITDEQCPDLANFFAQVLGRGVHRLIRRGLDRDYIAQHELTSLLRGRIDFTSSAKRQTWERAKMHCSYDDLSCDVLHNQILYSTLRLLYANKSLSKASKVLLKNHLEAFRGVSLVRITPRIFKRVQLHRNNRSYQFLLHLCELVHASLLPEHLQNESNEVSRCRQFRRIEENEKVMPYIFESFILNFARRHFPEAKSGRPNIYWLADYYSEQSEGVLPRMETDVTMAWRERKLIIECKYYKEAFARSRYSESSDVPEVQKLKTNNLYQVFAYLMNKRQVAGWENVEGLLLYPTTVDDFRYELSLSGSRLQVVSINLNQHWKKIEVDLVNIISNQRLKIKPDALQEAGDLTSPLYR